MMPIKICSLFLTIIFSLPTLAQDQTRESVSLDDLKPLSVDDYEAIEKFSQERMGHYFNLMIRKEKELRDLAADNPTYAKPRYWRYIPYGAALGALVPSILFGGLVALSSNSADISSDWLQTALFGTTLGSSLGAMIWQYKNMYSLKGDSWLKGHSLIGSVRSPEFSAEQWLPQTRGFGLSIFRFQMGDQLLTHRDLDRFGVQFDRSRELQFIIVDQFEKFQRTFVEPLDTRSEEHSRAQYESELMRLTATHWLYSEMNRAMKLLHERSKQRIAELKGERPNCIQEILGLAQKSN